MKPIIVLQTDFSETWGAVSEMKGVIKIVDRELEVEDSCHEIKCFDPWEASLALDAIEPYWPKGTVFVSVVDPGVGTSRRACVALLKDGSYVVTPDNGTLTHVKHNVGIVAVREIDETVNRYHAREKVSVFHGRDLFGYCAAKLASGIIDFAGVGPAYPVDEVVECEEYSMKPIIRDHYAEGFLMTGVKHFGGVEFNITNEQWEKTGFQLGDRVEVLISNPHMLCFKEIVPFEKSFGFVPEGEPVLYCGSSMYLSLDLNSANFMDTYGIDTGKDWTVVLRNPK